MHIGKGSERYENLILHFRHIVKWHTSFDLPGINLTEVQFLSRYGTGRCGRAIHQGPLRSACAIERGIRPLGTQSPQEITGRRTIVSEQRRANLISNRLESSWTGGVLQQRRVNPRGIRHG